VEPGADGTFAIRNRSDLECITADESGWGDSGSGDDRQEHVATEVAR
jgi:hypothetical protein